MDRKFLDWLWQWPSQVFFFLFLSEKHGFSSAKEIIANFLHKMIELIVYARPSTSSQDTLELDAKTQPRSRATSTTLLYAN